MNRLAYTMMILNESSCHHEEINRKVIKHDVERPCPKTITDLYPGPTYQFYSTLKEILLYVLVAILIENIAIILFAFVTGKI